MNAAGGLCEPEGAVADTHTCKADVRQLVEHGLQFPEPILVVSVGASRFSKGST